MGQVKYESGKLIAEVFKIKKSKNKAYSLRAFSRDLGVAASYLLALMNDKRCISIRLAKEISNRLFTSPADVKLFLQTVKTDIASSTKAKKNAPQLPPFHSILDTELECVKNWEHMAIFTLIETSDFVPKIDWIAARLGLPEKTVVECLKRLEQTGLVRVAEGRIQNVHKQLTSTSGIPAEALRFALKQQILHAANAFEDIPTQLRDVSSFCFAFDKKRIAEAREVIRIFRRRFAKRFSTGSTNEVYCLGLQFMPISKVNAEN